MASITSMMNSSYNTSSIYGNRNVLSGLASGMDTESMIENAISGIKLKITNLTKKRTKIEWQQEAYRSIIDKAVNFGTKGASAAGNRNRDTGALSSVGDSGYTWSSSPTTAGNAYTSFLWFAESYVRPFDSNSRTTARSVRCVQHLPGCSY